MAENSMVVLNAWGRGMNFLCLLLVYILVSCFGWYASPFINLEWRDSVSCEGGTGCMWWPWWPWGACRLPMGCVWAAYISMWLWCSWLLIRTNSWLVITARYCIRFVFPLDQFHLQHHASFHKKNDTQIPKLKVSLLFHFQLTTIPLLLSNTFSSFVSISTMHASNFYP